MTWTHEIDERSSYDVWVWRNSMCPKPPNRQSHERHLQKLQNFLQEVKERPWEVSERLQLERDEEIQVSF